MKVQKRYFVGKNKPGVWASVYAYRPNNEEIFTKRGEIFAAACLEGPSDFDSSIAGNLLMDLLHETYFESESESILEALEEATKAVQNRLMSLIENDQSAAMQGINFDLVTVVIKGEYFFSVRVGDGVLKVFREGNLQDLSAGFKDPTGEKKFDVVSSVVHEEDVFFLGSPSSIESYSDDEILESVSDFSEVALKNKMLEDDSKVSFLLVGMGLKERQKQEEAMVNIQPQEQDEGPQEELQGETEIGAKPTAEGKKKLDLENIKSKAGEKSAKAKLWLGSKVSQLKRKVRKTPVDPEVVSTDKSDDAEAKEPSITDKSTLQVYLSKFIQTGKNIARKLLIFIKRDILAIGSEGMYLKGGKRQINYRVVALLVIVLFLIFFFGMRMRRGALENARIERENIELIESLASELGEIKTSSVFTINTPDNISSRESVLAEITALEERIDGTEIAEEYSQELGDYIAELEELKNKLLRVIAISEPTLVSDLGATFEGASPSDIAISGDKLFVSDQARNVIYEVNPEGGQREFVSQELQAPRLLTADPEGGIVVLDNSNTALAMLNTETGQITRFVGMSSDKFSAAVEMTSYEVGPGDIRLYLAMNSDPQVQQVNKRASHYSDGPKSRWSGDEFNGLTDVDLLDGKFFVVKPGEGFLRLYVDSVMETTITGLIGGDNLSGATKMATDPLYVYVADSTNKRILVFTKSRGENTQFIDLIAQYKYTGDGDIFSNIKDIVVDKENIYILDGAKVFKLAKSDFGSFIY